MNIEAIEASIAQALDNEHRTERLTKVIEATGKDNNQLEILGPEGFEKAVNNAMVFLSEYIAHTPVVLREAMEAAQGAAVAGELAPFLAAAEKYWHDKMDIFPDHWGLAGILDDAYFSLKLLQRFSEDYQAKTGRALWSLDLGPANALAGQFIGQADTNKLDDLVEKTRNEIPKSFLSKLSARLAATLNIPDPIWGGANAVKLGAAGAGVLLLLLKASNQMRELDRLGQERYDLRVSQLQGIASSAGIDWTPGTY